MKKLSEREEENNEYHANEIPLFVRENCGIDA